MEKSEAFIGLGRIASLLKDTEKAMEQYQKATTTSPNSKSGYLSQALLLEDKGNHKEALSLLGKAQELAPKDQVVAAIANETRKNVALIEDKEKQDRIDQLVKELLESINRPPPALPSDGWTSSPLSMWIMEIRTQGYTLQEGEERLLASGLTDQILQRSRVQVVERALLDKLLQELKLGTSKLIDRNTALSLGRIVAAKLILSGQIVYAGPQTQVSFRLIETETGRITAAINESFGSAVPVSVLSEKLSGALLAKVDKLYPLRGKITEVEGEEVRLNIGQQTGIQMGERFKVVETGAVLETTAIMKDASTAKIAEGDKAVSRGFRVEVLKESEAK